MMIRTFKAIKIPDNSLTLFPPMTNAPMIAVVERIKTIFSGAEKYIRNRIITEPMPAPERSEL